MEEGSITCLIANVCSIKTTDTYNKRKISPFCLKKSGRAASLDHTSHHPPLLSVLLLSWILAGGFHTYFTHFNSMRFVCPCFLLFSLAVGSSNPSRTNNCCNWTPKHVLETNSTLRRKTDYRRGVKFSFCFTENEANEVGKKGGKQAGTTDPYENGTKKRGCKSRKLQQLKRKRRGGVGAGGSTRKKKRKKRKRKS